MGYTLPWQGNDVSGSYTDLRWYAFIPRVPFRSLTRERQWNLKDSDKDLRYPFRFPNFSLNEYEECIWKY